MWISDKNWFWSLINTDIIIGIIIAVVAVGLGCWLISNINISWV